MTEDRRLIGRTIIVGWDYSAVRAIIDHAPGEHPGSPIRDDLPAREYVTSIGSRWTALRPDGTPQCPPTPQPRI